jgi:dihydrofolate reductase
MIKLIACIDNNKAIGKDGNLLFHLAEDMQYF